jgi:hypothetical protein
MGRRAGCRSPVPRPGRARRPLTTRGVRPPRRVEERHAAHWARLLADAGVESAQPRTPMRIRLLLRAARRFGVDAVLPHVVRLEAGDRDRYRGVAEAPAAMDEEEASHGRIVALALTGGRAGAAVSLSERRHRAGAGGALRAALFGVSDGLVANFALVMGVRHADRATIELTEPCPRGRAHPVASDRRAAFRDARRRRRAAGTAAGRGDVQGWRRRWTRRRAARCARRAPRR